jgi:hypothetical protein
LSKSVNITALEGVVGPADKDSTPVIGNNLAISNNMTKLSNSTDGQKIQDKITSAMSQSKE